jgi:chorismate-pyruvate lyase
MNDPRHHGPDLRTLFALFPLAPGEMLPEFEIVPADEVPPPYHELLVHEHHMTVTVEAHHRDKVDVRIIARRHTGDWYARKILLALHGTGRIVQFGIMRTNFRYCSPEVREEIKVGQNPLGRILIQHNVLRRIEPTAYLRVLSGPTMMKWFGIDSPKRTYGRLAIIHCNGQPAVELLEIVAPEVT